MAKGVKRDWPSDERFEAIAKTCKSRRELSQRLGVAWATLQSHLDGHPERKALVLQAIGEEKIEVAESADGLVDAAVRKLISGKRRYDLDSLADEMDCAPRHVRESLDRLREAGYRIPEERGPSGEIVLDRIVPEKTNLHKSLLEGDELTYGVVSDTHLSSNEEALAELELAYDVFADEGITEVWHSGDFTCGVGIFRGQVSEIRNHTFETQVDYLVENYPRRDGIVTRGISGNHDIEGDFGKIGANPVAGLANRRDDIEFLGDYSAHVELCNGAFVHLLHGKGGMSYSYSYKAQKLVDGYPPGRKPAILLPGHWHVSGWIEQRGVQVVWPGCFEWRSKFLERLGLSPSVGFWIVRMTLGDDGSLVKFRPEFNRFWEGRRVVAAAA